MLRETLPPRRLFSAENAAWRCSVKKCVLKNFAKFTGNHPCGSLFLNKVADFSYFLDQNTVKKGTLNKETLANVFSCQFCRIFKNTFFSLNTSSGFWLSLIQICMYTQLEMPRSGWYVFYIVNNMRSNMLLNNWDFLNLQCFKLYLKNKVSVSKEQKRAHLKKVSVRRTNAPFFLN